MDSRFKISLNGESGFSGFDELSYVKLNVHESSSNPAHPENPVNSDSLFGKIFNIQFSK